MGNTRRYFETGYAYFVTTVVQERRSIFADEKTCRILLVTIEYFKLILDYKYPVERIRQFVTVQMGVSKKQADIIIYNDDACLSPYIIVECKHQEITDLEFKQAVDQAFSYAVAEGALYVWVTSGIADEYFLVNKGKTKARKTKTNIPKFGFDTTSEFNFIKGSHSDLITVKQDDLTRIFKQAHNTLWGGGELNPSEAFDDVRRQLPWPVRDNYLDRLTDM